MTINFKELTPTSTEPENIIPEPSESVIKKKFGNYVSFDRLFSTKNIFKLVGPKETTVVKLYKKKLDQNTEKYKILKKLTDDKNKAPNLLKLIKFGKFSDGYMYEQCEYKDKIFNLLDDETKTFVKNNIRDFIKQIAGAINILHKCNLLHLDVKPSNCFLISTDPIHFLLADYGNLVLLDEDQELYEAEHAGTLQFRAPECDSESGRHKVTKAADYYSLGVTIETIVNKNRFESIKVKKDIPYYKQVTKVSRVEENVPSLRNINTLLEGLQDVKYKRWNYEKIIVWLDNKNRQDSNNSGIINKTNELIFKNLNNAVPKANRGDIFYFKNGVYDDTVVIFDKRLIFQGIQNEFPMYNIYDELIIQSDVHFQYLYFHGKNTGENLFTVEENAKLTIENSTITCEKTFLLLSEPGAEITFTNNKKIEAKSGLFLRNCTLTIKNSTIDAKIGPAIIATENANVILENATIKTTHKSSPPILLQSKSKITIDDNTKITSKYGEYLALDETSTSNCNNPSINDKTIVYEYIV